MFPEWMDESVYLMEGGIDRGREVEREREREITVLYLSVQFTTATMVGFI